MRMANPTPEYPFGDPITVLKPNVPKCWEAQPVSGGGGTIPDELDVNVINTSAIPVSVSGTPSVSVTNSPTVTVGNTTTNPIPTQEVTPST